MPIPTTPILLLAVGALALILARWVQASRSYEAVWALAVLGTAGWLIVGDGHLNSIQPAPMSQANDSVAWANDSLALAGQWLALAIGTVFGLGSFGIRSPNDRTAGRLGYLSFLIVAVMLVSSAKDLMSLGLSVELVQFTCWALRKTDGLEQVHHAHALDDQAYRWLGIASSGCLWLGIAVLASLTASTEYDQIRRVLADAYVPGAGRTAIGAGSRLGLLGMGLIIAGLGSRVGFVPWQIGILEGCRKVSYWTAGCVTVCGQLAGIVALARLCGTVWVGYRDELMVLMIVLGGLTFVASGALAGLGLMPGEGRIRRWAASMLLLHGGWLAVGLLACISDLATPTHSLSTAGGQPSALAVLLFAAGASQAGLAGWFLVLSYLSRNDRDVEFVDELLGLGKLHPVAAISLLVPLASLIGQPPLCGFWSNWLLTLSALNVRTVGGRDNVIPHAGMIVIVVAAAASTLLAASVVIRFARVMLLEQPIARSLPQGRRSALAAGCGCALAILAVGLAPARLLSVLSKVLPPAMESGSEDPAGSSRGNSTAFNAR